MMGGEKSLRYDYESVKTGLQTPSTYKLGKMKKST